MRPSACSSIAGDPDVVQALHSLVRERLRTDYNIISKPSNKKVGQSHKFPTTPGRQQNSTARPHWKTGAKTSDSNKTATVFGRALRDLAPTTVILNNEDGGCSDHK